MMTLKAREVFCKPKGVTSDCQSDTAFQWTSLFKWKQTEIIDWLIISQTGVISKESLNKEMETNPFSNAPFFLLSFMSSPQKNVEPQTLPAAHGTHNGLLCPRLRQKLFHRWGRFSWNFWGHNDPFLNFSLRYFVGTKVNVFQGKEYITLPLAPASFRKANGRNLYRKGQNIP